MSNREKASAKEVDPTDTDADRFTARTLMSLVVDVSMLREATERIRITVDAICRMRKIPESDTPDV